MPTKKSVVQQKNTITLEKHLEPLVSKMTTSLLDFEGDDALSTTLSSLDISGDSLLPDEREHLTKLIHSIVAETKKDIYDKLRIGFKKNPDTLSAICSEFKDTTTTDVAKRNHRITIANSPTYKFLFPRLSHSKDTMVNIDILAFLLKYPHQAEFIEPYKNTFTSSLLAMSVRMPGAIEDAYVDCLSLNITQSHLHEFHKSKTEIIQALSVIDGTTIKQHYLVGFQMNHYAFAHIVNTPIPSLTTDFDTFVSQIKITPKAT
jgi:hypothetical protein